MSVSIPARAQAGLYGLLAVALYSALGFLLDGVKADRKAEDDSSPTSTYVRRFEKLKAQLPASEGRLGYLTDMGQDRGDTEFHLTQYALIPHILEKSKTPRYIVGNMVKPPEAAFLESQGLTILRDYGAGVILFEKRRAPQP